MNPVEYLRAQEEQRERQGGPAQQQMSEWLERFAERMALCTQQDPNGAWFPMSENHSEP